MDIGTGKCLRTDLNQDSIECDPDIMESDTDEVKNANQTPAKGSKIEMSAIKDGQ